MNNTVKTVAHPVATPGYWFIDETTPAAETLSRMYNEGRWQEAFDKGLAGLNQDHAFKTDYSAQLVFARICIGMMRYNDAIAILQRIPHSTAYVPRAKREAAQAFLGKQDRRAAGAQLAVLFREGVWTPEVLLTCGVYFASDGQHEPGQRLVSCGLALSPDMAEGYANLAALLQAPDLEKAETAALKAHALKPFLPGNLQTLARCRHKNGDESGAEALLRSLLDRQPWYVPAYVTLGEFATRRNDPFGALWAHYQVLIRSKPTDQLFLSVGARLASVGINQSAFDLLTIAIAVFPAERRLWDHFGQTAIKVGKRSAARRAFRIGFVLTPDDPEAGYNWGVFCTLDGHAEEAVEVAEKLVEKHPKYLKGHTLLSDALTRLGRLDEAAEAIERAADLQGESVDAPTLTQRANVFLRQENRVKARELLEKALELDPTYSLALSRLGEIYKDDEKYDESLKLFEKARDLRPDRTDGDIKIGALLTEIRRYDDAIALYREVLERDPEATTVVAQLANVLISRGRWDEAFEAVDRLLELKPKSPYAQIVKGEIYLFTDRLREALDCFSSAMQADPNAVPAMELIGGNLKRAGYPHLANFFFWRAYDLKPESPRRSFNLALYILYASDFSNGWDFYEYGFDVEKLGRQPWRDYQPQVLTKDDLPNVKGKSVLLWSEQGVGDHIMFMSVAHELQERGAKLMIEAEVRMCPLFARSFPDATVFKYMKKLNPMGHKADYHLPMGSLPYIFRRSVDSFKRQRRTFLQPDPDRTAALREKYLDGDDVLLIGIGWKGGRQPKRQESRSVPLPLWGPIFKQKGVRFVNVQYGDVKSALEEARTLHGVEIIHDETIDPLLDLDGSAAQIAAMDLVISATNAGVHTAGGLGVPCWSIVPLDSDWRWTWGREDSLWYPGMRVFRKTDRYSWEGVVETVGRELERYLAGDTSVLRASSWDDLDPAGLAQGAEDQVAEEDTDALNAGR